MRTFRCIYGKCFDRFRLVADSAQNYRKALHNLRIISQEGNMETRQMTRFFPLLFPVELFATFIFVHENSQSSFSFGLPFDPFWHVKCLNFGQKLSIGSTPPFILECRYPEVTKNPYYVLSPKRNQKKVFRTPAVRGL